MAAHPRHAGLAHREADRGIGIRLSDIGADDGEGQDAHVRSGDHRVVADPDVVTALRAARGGHSKVGRIDHREDAMAATRILHRDAPRTVIGRGPRRKGIATDAHHEVAEPVGAQVLDGTADGIALHVASRVEGVRARIAGAEDAIRIGMQAPALAQDVLDLGHSGSVDILPSDPPAYVTVTAIVTEALLEGVEGGPSRGERRRNGLSIQPVHIGTGDHDAAHRPHHGEDESGIAGSTHSESRIDCSES